MTVYTVVDSPIGPLTVTAEGASITGLHMAPAKVEKSWKRDDRAKPLLEAKKQLGEYFKGLRTRFDLPLAPKGTPFQLKVWEALREIPYGETRSYVDIAEYVGNPGASRAVGGANGRNPIAVIVPCHRVIAADGTLGGFGGGLDRKRKLLALERRDADLFSPAGLPH